MPVTPVLSSALSNRLKCSAIRFECENLRRLRILLLRHEAGLFEQRQVDIALDIACRAGIPVPVPGAAKGAARLDHADILETRLAQPRCRQHPAKPAADHGHLDMILHRRAFHTLRIRVIEVMRELPGHVHILLVAILAHALVAFRQIARLQGGRIKSKVECAGIGHAGFLQDFAGKASSCAVYLPCGSNYLRSGLGNSHAPASAAEATQTCP
jgi:hypothetical protein